MDLRSSFETPRCAMLLRTRLMICGAGFFPANALSLTTGGRSPGGIRMMLFLRVSAVLALAFAASISGAIIQGAAAQTYPARPVKIIVPFAPGGPADIFARQLGQYLSESLKQSFVIEDRPGAGSILGTEAGARSAPGGQTLLAMSNTHTTNESLIPNKPTARMRHLVAAEASAPGCERPIRPGLMAAAAPPKPIIDKLNAEVVKIISRGNLQKIWAEQGAVSMIMDPAEFDKFLRADVAKWAHVVEVSGAK